MNVIKYCWPFQEVVGNGPHISVCINSKTLELLLALNFLVFVCFSLATLNIYIKVREIEGFKYSIWHKSFYSPFEDVCPRCLCHRVAEFSFDNFHLDIVCKVSLIEAIIFSIYNLSIKEPVITKVKLRKRLNLFFPNEQEKPYLSNAEIEIKFCLNDGTT